MRSIFAVAAAFVLAGGLAAAQTTTPAPEGAVNAPVQTPASGSPGKTGSAAPAGSMTMAPGGNPGSSDPAAPSTPAPQGATNAPMETPASGSPGKTAPASGGMSQ